MSLRDPTRLTYTVVVILLVMPVSIVNVSLKHVNNLNKLQYPSTSKLVFGMHINYDISKVHLHRLPGMCVE